MPVLERIEEENIARWLLGQGLGYLHVRRLPDVGFVNRVFLIGEKLILRVTKSDGDAHDAYTESVAVPVAVESGVQTPELLVFDDSKSILPTVATLYQKTGGVTLGRQQVDQKELPFLYGQIGEQLGILHRNVASCEDPNGYLDKPTIFDARALLNTARSKMKVEAVSYDWLARWLDILEPAAAPTADPVFLHNDLHSFNVMVNLDPLRLASVLDWGDAGWGDPAIEFGTMPVWAVDWLLEGYEKAFRTVEDRFFGRLLWHDIGAALDASIDLWVETDEPWQPLTTSRWINLVRHLAYPKDERWARWMPKASI